VRWRGVVRVCCPEIVRVPSEAARLTWQGAIRNGAATGKMKERPPTEVALLRFRGEPTHESVAVPKLNVVALNELFGRFNGGGIVRVMVREFGYNGIEMPVDTDDVGAIIWHDSAP
jgi:hypothetical protein